MHLLGRHLPDHQRLMYSLKAFYGLSHPLSRRLLARLSIPEQALVSDITETQITALSGYLSSPAASKPPAPTPLAAPNFGASSSKQPRAPMPSEAHIKATNAANPLNFIQVESDLRRTLHANLQHLRAIGTYRGRRHAMGFPARGQNTRSNAHTALRLNRINRRNFSSSRVLEALGYTEVPQPPSDILRLLGKQ